MPAIDDLRALLEPIAKQRGITLTDLDPEALVRELDDETIDGLRGLGYLD